jgi:hypothetical protein
MVRKRAAFLKGLHGTDDGPSLKIISPPQWPLGVRGTALAATVLVLLGVVAFGVSREATTTARPPGSALSRPAATPPKPAFTRAEEAYIQALWPIHGDVERSAIRMSLGKIFYKTNDLGKADLKARVDAALTTFRRAETRISALQPPPSFAREHEGYLAAVRLFEQSAVEVLKMFDDGNDEHLLAAYPMSREGSDKIREIGVKFWEDEFPAH